MLDIYCLFCLFASKTLNFSTLYGNKELFILFIIVSTLIMC